MYFLLGTKLIEATLVSRNSVTIKAQSISTEAVIILLSGRCIEAFNITIRYCPLQIGHYDVSLNLGFLFSRAMNLLASKSRS